MSPKGSAFNLLQLKLFSLISIIQNSTKLETLLLSYVTISYSLPNTLTNLTSLKTLSLYNSELYGEFPVRVFDLPNLKVLDLRYNPNLKGRLPEFHSSSLTKLALDQTGFYGTLPISLKDNKFRGDPSASLANLTKLSILNVGFNDFTADTISWIGKLSSLISLDISSVNIGSDIPLSFANITQLEVLNAINSNIKGEIPSWPNLVFLNIHSNFLHGKIDLDMFLKLKKLVFLNLSYNKLSLYSGKNSSLMPGSQIQVVQLASCNLVEIPTFTRDTQMSYVVKQQYNIATQLVMEKSKSTNLRWNSSRSLEVLMLKGNKLSGLIPQTYQMENNLQMIDLSNNNLHGPLPRTLVNNIRLKYFEGIGFKNDPKLESNENFQHKSITVRARGSLLEVAKSEEYWTIDNFYSFTMSNKGLVMVYMNLQKFYYSLIAIDISSNKISGEIPQVIGDLKDLVFLNLSNNILTGHIPSSLGKLSNLEASDLSLNSFSGNLPQQLTQLTFLEFFNVSFNNLSGLYLSISSLQHSKVIPLRVTKVYVGISC
ncbi:unnamed protein product [Trifolium pratense]|uniref:Uncharacterized protein n=1 Tax=Trifolium pratense TaxID=57577 RepID=A0ACB0LKP8_TRIPR|nr:unnamed protein product [Trifolium pratense]